MPETVTLQPTDQAESRDGRVKYKRLVAEETLILAVTEAIAEAINVHRQSYAQIAAASGMKVRHVRKFMAGDRVSVRDAAAIAFALGKHFTVKLEPGKERP